MNYEELLAAKRDQEPQTTRLPIGNYRREQRDGKWCGVVDIHSRLNENIVFSEALKTECEKNKTLGNRHQLHYTAVEEHGDVTRLELEPGYFLTFEQLLLESPAVVAGKGFFDHVLAQLVDITTYLHRQGICHVCYSPRTVLVRRGDLQLMLLSHGSFYNAVGDQQFLYDAESAFVAPEVLNHGTIDDRCDVYSIGKFMYALFDQADLPFEYREVLRKAVSEEPEGRYDTPEDMLRAVQRRRGLLRSALTLAAAVVLGLVCVGLYFELVPETEPVEFVKPVPRQATDDLLDDGFDPAELGVVAADSVGISEEVASQREFQAKAEEIFRKKFEKEADRVLSKIYNTRYMSNSEKKFLSESESTIGELMNFQTELGGETGLDPTRSQVIASEIIERLTNQKKQALGGTNSRGVQLPKD